MAGYFYPRTATGKASLLPAPPWYYSGDLLTVEYRTDPARVAGDATLASSKNDLEGETYLMADSSSLPGLKRATFLALIWMVSPVWGLRPTRALRLLE